MCPGGGAGRRAGSRVLSGEYDGQLVSEGEGDVSRLGGVGARGGEGSRIRGGVDVELVPESSAASMTANLSVRERAMARASAALGHAAARAVAPAVGWLEPG